MASMELLPLSESWAHETAIMEKHIKLRASDGQTLQILEAGCGQFWRPNMDGVRFFLTGIDLDAAALEIRKKRANDLHEIIEGDLRTVVLEQHKYDVIYCSFVLEHIKGAEQVMESFSSWLKDDGLIIITIPDPKSVSGFVTRLSPHWFHVLFVKYVYGNKNAGKPGHAPYQTHYDPIVSRRGIHEFCAQNGFTILEEFGDGYLRPGRGIIQALVHGFKLTMSALSFGRLSSRHTNLFYILQKNGRQ